MMQRISSSMTFFYKRIFPVIWFGFLLVFIVVSVSRTSADQVLPFVIVPLAMMGFGFWIMKKLVFNLVDEVLDAGDALVVRNGGQQERIALADIKNVNYSPYMSPPQVTLAVRRRTVFGDTVTFCAPVSVVGFWSSPVIEELINRVDEARLRRR
jgi:hypothetical protein